eukprot:m.196917 g.196917  ORF g.196917 m.196917 type:complete len:384 (+) comp18337_c1_seq1:288-1439(+)
MSARRCHKCQEVGHIAKACPQRVKKPPKCFTCGQTGHMRSQCPNQEVDASERLAKPTPRGHRRKQRRHQDSAGSADAVELSPYPTSSVPYVDSHAHLDYLFEKKRYSELSLDTFGEMYGFPSNFGGCITQFCDPASLSPSLGIYNELLAQHNVWGCFGCHPHNAKYYTQNLEDRIEACIKDNPRAVAWGECGLDYSQRSQSPHDVQQDVFRRQIKAAVRCGVPLVVHSRDAAEDTFSILDAEAPDTLKIHLHCCTDNCDTALKFLKRFPNLFIGIAGNVTFSKAKTTLELAFDLPLDRLLLETDSPYMFPANFPGSGAGKQWSYPAHAICVAEKIAETKRITLDEVLLAALRNVETMYGVTPSLSAAGAAAWTTYQETRLTKE